jgi:excisionase family DNA binding protein
MVTLAELRSRATVTVEEAARILGVGRGSAYEAARNGQIPTLRLGRRILVPVPALLKVLGESDESEADVRGEK